MTHMYTYYLKYFQHSHTLFEHERTAAYFKQSYVNLMVLCIYIAHFSTAELMQ